MLSGVQATLNIPPSPTSSQGKLRWSKERPSLEFESDYSDLDLLQIYPDKG